MECLHNPQGQLHGERKKISAAEKLGNLKCLKCLHYPKGAQERQEHKICQIYFRMKVETRQIESRHLSFSVAENFQYACLKLYEEIQILNLEHINMKMAKNDKIMSWGDF